MDFQLGFWADPIYRTGDYPQSVKTIIGNDLPQFTEEEKELNRDSSDFFGLNHYTTRLYEKCEDGSANCDHGIKGTICDDWLTSGSSWLFSVPWGFRKLLNYVHDTYDSDKYPIYITENGISSSGTSNGTDSNPGIDDYWRINHYHGYIGQMQRAITEDGVNVKAYTAWSLMDNFEWSMGYSERFGLIWVNYTDPERTLFWKDSARYYQQVAESNFVAASGTDNLSLSIGIIIGMIIAYFFFDYSEFL